MNILVIGGTRFFGVPMINKLLDEGHEVTIATRGITRDSFGNKVRRIKMNIYEGESVQKNLRGKSYDVVIDKMGYGSLDIKNILDSVKCERFIHMSTAGVYTLDHMNIVEEEFDGSNISLKWCSRGDAEYDDVKRQAEAALCQKYNEIDWTSVRAPYVVGKNDYTKRLLFYVEHIMSDISMYIDNLDEQICFANAIETGEFLADLIYKRNVGSINVCAEGTMSIRDIVYYVEQKTGHKLKLDEKGDTAPYNGTMSNSLCLKKAKAIGKQFENVHTWMPVLLDYYIDQIKSERVN